MEKHCSIVYSGFDETYGQLAHTPSPQEDSILWLMGSVLIELNKAMLYRRAVFSKRFLLTLMKSDVSVKRIIIFEEQSRLLVA